MEEHIMMIRVQYIVRRAMPLSKEMAKTFLKTMSINIVGIVSVTNVVDGLHFRVYKSEAASGGRAMLQGV